MIMSQPTSSQKYALFWADLRWLLFWMALGALVGWYYEAIAWGIIGALVLFHLLRLSY